MLKISLFLFIVFLASACGGFKIFDTKTSKAGREIASISLKQLLNEEDTSFSAEIDDKLTSLHSYYVIGQKNRLIFDKSAYLNLLAINTQVKDIESELVQIGLSSKEEHLNKNKILIGRIELFAKKSDLSKLSMGSLLTKVSDHRGFYKKTVSIKDVEKEYAVLSTLKEFQIYEKNIEHLSHLMEMRIRSETKRVQRRQPASS
jgi:hypothetical protein